MFELGMGEGREGRGRGRGREESDPLSSFMLIPTLYGYKNNMINHVVFVPSGISTVLFCFVLHV